MSTMIMAACWPLRMPPTPKAVLISLADNANDHGDCWPSLQKICERTCFGKTAVIEAIRWLEEAGLVTANRDNGRHTTYTVTPAQYAENQSASQTGSSPGPVRLPDRTGAPPGQDLSASRTKPVRQADTNRKEPSRTKSKAPVTAPRGQVTFDAWILSLGDQDAIAHDDPIFDWAERAGIPAEFQELAWLAFADRYSGDPKRYADWRAVFRNAVRGNWLKVWFLGPQGYTLTTIGEQYRRVRDSQQQAAA